jgi:hypothetical protein
LSCTNIFVDDHIFAFGIFSTAGHHWRLLEIFKYWHYFEFTLLFYYDMNLSFEVTYLFIFHTFILVKIDVNRCPSRSGCELYFFGSGTRKYMGAYFCVCFESWNIDIIWLKFCKVSKIFRYEVDIFFMYNQRIS